MHFLIYFLKLTAQGMVIGATIGGLLGAVIAMIGI